jgi:putative redox protein
MKVENYKFRLEATADSTEEHPISYHTIYLNYIFEGNDLPVEKLKRAIELSETRYCGVSAMLGKAADIKTKIILNGETV